MKGDLGFSKSKTRMLLEAAAVAPPGQLLGGQEQEVNGVSVSQVNLNQDLATSVDVLVSNTADLAKNQKKLEEGTQEASSSMPGGRNRLPHKSWVGAVVQKRVFSQQKFVVSEIDGHEKVVVPKEVFVGAKPLWEDFLIGKFLNTKAPHVGKIHMIVNKIWRLGDRTSLIDVFEVNENTVKFRIRNEGMRHRILNRGMWNIMDIPMIVSKWTPFAEEAQPAMKSIPLWVTLTNVPTTMFTDKGLEFLASAVGEPIKLHPKTEACVSFDEAQILVKADLTKDLPKEYSFTGEEEGELDSVINYSYPWLPPRCSGCQKWGHLHESCLLSATKTITESPSVKINGEEEGTKSISVQRPSAVEGAEKNTKMTKDIVDVEGGGLEEKATEQVWITPKSGHSPRKLNESLKFGEVSILKNTFSVLNDENHMDTEENKGKGNGVEEQVGAEKQVKDLESEANAGDEVDHTTDPDAVPKPRGGKPEVSLRPSLPRGIKTAAKSITNISTKSARGNSRDQSKRTSSKHH